jgi:N-acetylglutamate synthase
LNISTSAPSLRSLLSEIEAAAVRGWPALETVAVDGWLWRHSSGGSMRANSVATLAFTGGCIDAAIDRVEALARQCGAPARFTISDVAAPAKLSVNLAARGYASGHAHVTMAKLVDANTSMPADVTASTRPTADWVSAYLSGLSGDRRTAAPQILERLPPNAVFISAQGSDGHVISSGLSIGDGTVASVQCMATLPEAQRRGGAQRVLQAIETIAARAEHTALYLQADSKNAGAIALYERAGFSVIGHYHLLTKQVV